MRIFSLQRGYGLPISNHVLAFSYNHSTYPTSFAIEEFKMVLIRETHKNNPLPNTNNETTHIYRGSVFPVVLLQSDSRLHPHSISPLSAQTANQNQSSHILGLGRGRISTAPMYYHGCGLQSDHEVESSSSYCTNYCSSPMP